MQRKTIKEYDVLRVIVTFLVIIGHCTYYQIVTRYGLWDFSAYAETGMSMLYHLACLATTFIYTVHMPLYLMLSGALFRYTEKSGGGKRYSSLCSLCAKKAKNLLIPFAVVTLCYAVPLKYLSGYYAGSPHVFTDVFLGQILLQGNSHLWFLPVLFLIFLLTYFVNHGLSCTAIVKLALLFLISCFSGFIPITLISSPLNYALWFYAGYCFEDKREKFNQYVKLHPSRLMAIAGLWVALAVINGKLMPTEGVFFFVEKASRALCTLLGCCAVYGCAYLLAETKLPETPMFLQVRENTLGLYLYSDPLNYVILFLAVRWFGSSVFSTNLGALCLCGSRFILTSAIAYGMSCLARKCNLRYLC